MKVSSSCSTLFSALLCAAFVPSAYALSLDEALRAHSLTLVADFFKAYPPDPALLNVPKLIVYAPTNQAMQQYFDSRNISLNNINRIQRYLLTRDPAITTSDANNLLAYDTSTIDEVPKVINTGGNGTEDAKVIEGNPSLTTGTIAPNTSTTPPTTTTSLTASLTTEARSNSASTIPVTKTTQMQVVRTITPTPTATGVAKRALEKRALQERPPPLSWLAKIYSGNGALSFVIENRIPFDGGFFYTMDSMFTLAKDFISSITESGFSALQTALNRIPDTLATLQNNSRITFLAPSPDAFAAAQNQLSALTDAQLRVLFDYHTIASGFIGYTPTFQHGKTYKTKSGLSFVVTFKGNDIYINDAKIVARNRILKNGVIQVLDKFLIPPAPGATTVPGPDGPLTISKDTTEDDDPFNPNPGKPSNTTTYRPTATYTGGSFGIQSHASLVAICLAVAGYFAL